MNTPRKSLLLHARSAFWPSLPRLLRPRPLPSSAGRDPLAPASSGGAPAVDRALARLAEHRRLLMVAAHPDDEDTRLLTLVSRGYGGEAAYLSLSRGDGGQNLIGPEVGPGLGLLRSRELQAARGIDGARQFFTRAYDFGFTNSLEETQRRWPRRRCSRTPCGSPAASGRRCWWRSSLARPSPATASTGSRR